MHRIARQGVAAAAAALVASGCAGLAPPPTPPAALAQPAPLASGLPDERWPRVSSMVPRDAQVEARIDAILARMTIEEKVAQIVQPDISSVTPDDVRRYKFGSILAGGNSSPGGNEKASPAEWLKLADAFWKASDSAAWAGEKIPLMWGIDAVHGHANIVGATIFPQNVGLGATRDPELIRRIGEVTAREMVVTGIDGDLSPTLAVVRDDRWGRTYEGFRAALLQLFRTGGTYDALASARAGFGSGSSYASGSLAASFERQSASSLSHWSRLARRVAIVSRSSEISVERGEFATG